MQKKVDIKKIVLVSVATAGVLGIGLLAPNALGAMAKLGLLPGKRQKEVIDTARKRLIRQGLLVYKDGFVQLTPKGEKELRHLEIRDYKVKKPRRWDGRWHMLIFDIPEKRKKTREQIRITLARIGFVHLQHSVWAYPYDCEELITLLKADMHVGSAVLYMVVEKLEGDTHLRKCFEL